MTAGKLRMSHKTIIFAGMLSKQEILNTLKGLKESLARYGVSKIGLFGSSARGEAGRDSDIDILVDFYGDMETYRNFMAACEVLENGLRGQKVDVVTVGGLSPFIGPHILNEVVYV
jgi:predicted nucleotidyltransferase